MVFCRRKERQLCKRKCEYNGNDNGKKQKVLMNDNIYKRKAYNNLDKNNKRQKVDNIYCLFHGDKYICDIYECSGIKCLKTCDNMPYIL